MAVIKALYQHRVDGTELVNHEKDVSSYAELCEIIDNYPWVREFELFEELGEGGGFYFWFGDEDGEYASYQLTPIGIDNAFLDVDIILKRGFLGVFGRKAVSKHFDELSIPEAKQRLKEIFNHTIDSLYEKYKQ